VVDHKAMLEHTIVHQFDPAEHVAGGVHGFITDLIRLAPDHHRFRIIGVDAIGGRRLGTWSAAEVGGRDVSFLPVARLSAGRSERRVPHTLRLVGGLLLHRPRLTSDFVHAHRGETGLVVAAAFRRVPLVQFVHTDAAEAMRHRTESFWRYLPRTHLLAESLAVRRAAAAWVYSAEAARRLGASADGVKAGQNWYDDALFRPSRGVRRDQLTIGWIGRFEPSKDPLRAVAVFAELARRGVRFHGWFAGSGTLDDAVRRNVERHGLTGQVSQHGTLAPIGVARLLEETDVLLVTSLWEGQPRAVLEALGAGVPVVSTAVGDVPELVQEGISGFISRSGTPDRLADFVVEAATLSDRDGIAATVAGHRASQVIGALFAELERLPRPVDATAPVPQGE
jgi:glycosyltransferase involved in cell wall biosynthesis